MTARFRLCLVALALVAVVAAPALLAQSTNRYFGPNFPALVDSNGNGRPDPGVDAPFTPRASAGEGTLISPWQCDTSAPSNYFSFDDPSGGRYQTVRRQTYGREQAVTVTQATAGGAAISFSLSETNPSAAAAREGQRVTAATGAGGFVDNNGDGIYDGVSGSGNRGSGPVSVSTGFVLSDITGDAYPDYVSVPWSQSAALGVKPNFQCTPGNPTPQVFVPLADSNGDGHPDSVILDLDGDTVPDPDVYQSPILAPNPTGGLAANEVPTLSQWGLVGLAASLAAAGWLFLRKSGLGLGV